MGDIERSFVLVFLIAMPPLYGSIGAWLSSLGPSEGIWDELFSAWPLASIGSVVSAVSYANIVV
jgi:hypothetical protein